MAVFEELEAHAELQPDVVSFNAAIAACGAAGSNSPPSRETHLRVLDFNVVSLNLPPLSLNSPPLTGGRRQRSSLRPCSAEPPPWPQTALPTTHC
eukprot:1175804-Prorocentrum_minimum.AAC.2